MANVNGIEIKLDTSQLDMLMNGLQPKAEELLDAGASKIEERWKEYIVLKQVIDTGAYLNSIHVKKEHPPLQRTIADEVEYGVHNEFGTVKMAARPCATPAVEDERKPFMEAWSQLFR